MIIRLLLWLKQNMPIIAGFLKILNEIGTKLLYKSKIDKLRGKAILKKELSGQSFVIKPLYLKDIDSLFCFLNNMPKSHLQFFAPHYFDKNNLQKIVLSYSILTFGLFYDNKLVGYCLVKLFFWNRSAFLGRIVSPEFTGKGLGKFMSQHLYSVISFIQFYGYTTISQKNIASLRSHQSLKNFTIKKRLPQDYHLIQFNIRPEDNLWGESAEKEKRNGSTFNPLLKENIRNFSMNKTVSVIVPVRNNEKHVANCLDSILAQDYHREKLEILVADGMSEDGTRKILKEYCDKYSHISILDNPSRMTPQAFNIGIRNSKGEIITLMSPHCTFTNNYISKCVEYLHKTKADNIGGITEHRGEGFTGSAIAFASVNKFGLGGAKFRTAQKAQYVDTVFPGAWPRETFEKYGYFNDQLIRNQDIEHNFRIRKNGGKVYFTPEIKCVYFCRSNLKDLWKQNFGNGIWSIKTVKIAPGSLSLRHFVPLIFVCGLIGSMIFSFFSFWGNILLLLIIGSYLLAVIFFSIKIGFTKGIKHVFILPIIFMTMHLSYGFGSLMALIRLK